MMFSNIVMTNSTVLRNKDKVKYGYLTQKLLIQLLHETNKQPFPGYISIFSFMFYMRGHHYTFGEFHIF